MRCNVRAPSALPEVPAGISGEPRHVVVEISATETALVDRNKKNISLVSNSLPSLLFNESLAIGLSFCHQCIDVYLFHRRAEDDQPSKQFVAALAALGDGVAVTGILLGHESNGPPMNSNNGLAEARK